MGIVELCKVEKDTIWNDTTTILYVFDESGNEIADYDLYSGLKVLQGEDFMSIFIADEDLVPGRWKFCGTTVDNNQDLTQNVFETEGVKEGKPFDRKYQNDNPWDQRYTTMKPVSAEKREERMNICRSCPFFIPQEGRCLSSGVFVIESTKNERDFCPEEKWGTKYITEQSEVDTLVNQEQEGFEEELEEFLKGL